MINRAIRIATYTAIALWSVLLISSVVRADDSHSNHKTFWIDNMADAPGFGANAIDPIHHPIHDQGTDYAEGQATNLCFENETTNPNIGMGKTYKELHQWAMRWRRTDVNEVTTLAARVNFAKGYAEGSGRPYLRIPFWDYDPFSFDPLFQGIVTWPEVHHPILISDYNNNVAFLNQFDQPVDLEYYNWDNNTTRYDWFAYAQETFGGHSFMVPAPMKYEGMFNYYDRIPAAPTFDPCIKWVTKKLTCAQNELACLKGTDGSICQAEADVCQAETDSLWDYVLDQTAAHEEAGRLHHILMKKRTLYSFSVIYRIKDGSIR